ncbi:YfhH family protein [Bacillus taeanensis]|uniref:YfhH family protein n=1 Tax=Bacillus taeanensis TaxID=273032 RepID=UPI001FE475CD|nr:YfhH family protein [Bacillus taeanensis]
MERRYSEHTPEELRAEIASLTEKARKAEQMGIVNEAAVLERKITLAKAYLLNPDDFKSEETYELEGDPGSFFTISYLNGRFAWGYRNQNEKLEAFPISMLINKK